jgi:hypothetical protein
MHQGTKKNVAFHLGAEEAHTEAGKHPISDLQND